MGLRETIDTRIKDAMKNRREVERDALRHVMGEVRSREAKGEVDDTAIEGIINKLIKDNNETLSFYKDDSNPNVAILREKNQVLKSVLPQTASQDEIRTALEPVVEEIKALDNEGKARGVAMKHLKTTGIKAASEDVVAVVAELRS